MTSAAPARNGLAGRGEGFVVVMPDHPATSAVASRLQDLPNVRSLLHPSGRPWVVGRWAEWEFTAVSVGNAALAVLGCCPVTRERLAAAAGGMRDLATLDSLSRTLPGSFHLLAALDGHVRAQGTASGLRLLFVATVGGVTIACDRADLLAGLAGAQLDEAQVAVRLLWPVPHPLLDTPLWRGLEAVRAGSSVVISPAGRPRFSRWWTAPEPTASLAAGAPALAEALAVAVRARTTGRATVSTDLSGGLDSTSVCFLAAAGDARVLAGTWPGRDPADDDLAWARRAAAHLPQVEHLVWPAEASPLVYEQLLDIDDPLDEPTIGLPDRARVLCHIPLLRDRGSQVHLTGIGGDHLTWSAEAHYHGVLRRNPRLALRNLRGFRALFDWRPTQLARALADNSTYSGWLARAAEQLRDPVPDAGFCALGWGQPPRLHPWMTELVFAESRRALRRAAATAEPLAGTRGEHADLEQIRVTTRILRQWDQMCARLGLPMASPFLDDRVIDVCLAVRPEERVTPWQYKPLLVAAMRGIVPDECLARTTKAQAALDVARGLQRHRTDLLTLWEDSRLETLGLVDTKALRELTLRPSTPGMQEAVLYSTICTELWLRTLEAAEPLRAARHA